MVRVRVGARVRVVRAEKRINVRINVPCRSLVVFSRTPRVGYIS